MRLTIARKIALAVIAIAIASIGTMAWVTSTNIKHGFIAYLNDIQAQDLDQLAPLLAARYQQEGNWDWLRHRPAALREVLDKMTPHVLAEPEGGNRRNPAPRARADAPPREPAYGRPRPPRQEDFDRAREDRPPADPERRRLKQREIEAARAQGWRPGDPWPFDTKPPPPPPRADGPPPPAPNPPGQRDPMAFASRISIAAADGEVLVGPPDFPPGAERKVVVDGKTVAIVRLRPLRSASEDSENASASVFLREQVSRILWLSGVLVAASVLVAVWLARHLLRPVAALRSMTARIARGELDARAPLLSRDELAELALHVNEMAAALEQNEQQRRRMIADISHELRTPLTVIRGEIEALLDGIRQADPGALESLHAEVLRLNKLVEDLHQLTLADTGGLSFHWQPVDMGALLLPLLERYKLRAASAGLDLAWKLPEKDITLEADADRLTQVFLNLLENSVRYTDKGGFIAVELKATPTHAEVTIDDSAPGVPNGAHARIFDRLYRVDSARTRERGGSGLGLAIVKAMVEAHGGSIMALPSPLGGVRMHVRLPFHAKHAK